MNWNPKPLIESKKERCKACKGTGNSYHDVPSGNLAYKRCGYCGGKGYTFKKMKPYISPKKSKEIQYLFEISLEKQKKLMKERDKKIN